MVLICRLLMVGLAVVITGFLTGCSGNDSQQDSELPTATSLTLQTVTTSLNFPVFLTAAPDDNVRLFDQPPVVRPPFKFLHADTLSGAKVRVSGAGGRYPSALCGRCVL